MAKSMEIAEGSIIGTLHSLLGDLGACPFLRISHSEVGSGESTTWVGGGGGGGGKK